MLTPHDLPLINAPLPHQQRVETLIAAFRGRFGREPEGIAEAPGRVNLIGEHVDYNDGLVLPIAIDRSVLCAWAATGGSGVRVASANFGPDADAAWMAYPLGTASAVEALTGERVTGVDLMLAGDVPQGAGLSSSAAVEVATAGAVRKALALRFADVDLCRACQRAENEHVGVQCGIMDQFASALSRAGHALLVDCRTLDTHHVPLRLAEHGLAIVIADSAVKRELVMSAYNDRRRECEEAVVGLRALLGRPELSSLRDVSLAEVGGIAIAKEDVVLRRVRHVVSEIARVAEAVEALGSDDFARLGEFMVESHRSLRDDYAVSSEQLDLLVGLATAQDYVLGARLTGAGFGGCTVNVVRADRAEDFARDVIAPYRERTGLPSVMYVTPSCEGLRTWWLGSGR